MKLLTGLTAAVVYASTTSVGWAGWMSIEDSVATSQSRAVFDRVNRAYISTVSITNATEQPLNGPFRVLVTQNNIPASSPDGYTYTDAPYWLVAAATLAPGETISKAIPFELQRQQLSYQTTVQQDNPGVGIYAEAEGGADAQLRHLGEAFLLTQGATGYVSIASTQAEPPQDDSRVGELAVYFPRPGQYNLYARVRVGPEGANDDSLFINTRLNTEQEWTLVNSIGGYAAPGEPGYQKDEIVAGLGSALTESFMWTRMVDTQYTVEVAGEHIFRYAGREDGLDIDKFVFAPAELTYTVDELEQGRPGTLVPPPAPYVPEGPPLAQGLSKFLGGVCCGRQRPNFEAYWNQVTPENAGKWGSVEAVRDEYNWTELDEAYNLAKNNNYIYKHHVLVWGNQQPSWISTLPAEEQLEEITEWFNEVNNRYPSIDYIEVVNEFDNDPPDSANNGPGYIDALRLANPQMTQELTQQFLNAGMTPTEAQNKAAQYDWIINSFQLARDIFPAHTKLMFNEYNVVNSTTRTAKMVELANLLNARGLIDAVGFQGHAFSTTGPLETIKTNIDTLAEQTGLDLYLTELDIDGTDELTQLLEYQRLFPVFWEHPAIQGVTMWGYLPGHWREAQGAILAYENGAEKAALTWLRSYVRNEAPSIDNPGAQQIAPEATIGTPVVDLVSRNAQGNLHEELTSVTWTILGGNEAGLFELNSHTGEIVVNDALRAGIYNLYIQIEESGYTSKVLTLPIVVPGDDIAPTVIEYTFENDAEGWRGDYGTAASVEYNADAKAAVLLPDWTDNPTEQVYIKEISLSDLTDADLEYSVSVSMAQVQGGLTVQPFVQTGAPSYARLYGEAIAVNEGLNTLSFAPVDDGSGNLEIIERLGLQLNGPLASGQSDAVLLTHVSLTLPVVIPPTNLVYDFASDVQGLRADYGTNAAVDYDAGLQAAILLPSPDASSHNYIMQISATDFNDAQVEITLNSGADIASTALTAQAYVQTGAPDYTRVYGTIEPVIAGSQTLVFVPENEASLGMIERIAIQLNGTFSGSSGQTVKVERIAVTF
ncbi:endo-1,4-beta-xylanase [Salinimonas sediminis]|uniref:endo-1,4-beta-xylanase n=1 Tax=Salinimonas sediminis TaxID=2303538 RepID=A0A346NKQ0_9ALTE|nr:endo-1,4-beta-xylanase [Salinimonas sediminis]AXR06107.1 1,4-beta-xylanase [Salinimonas sediminis]